MSTLAAYWKRPSVMLIASSAVGLFAIALMTAKGTHAPIGQTYVPLANDFQQMPQISKTWGDFTTASTNTVTVEIAVMNTGGSTWTKAGGYALVWNNPVWGPSKPIVSPQPVPMGTGSFSRDGSPIDSAAPGQTVLFRTTVDLSVLRSHVQDMDCGLFAPPVYVDGNGHVVTENPPRPQNAYSCRFHPVMSFIDGQGKQQFFNPYTAMYSLYFVLSAPNQTKTTTPGDGNVLSTTVTPDPKPNGGVAYVISAYNPTNPPKAVNVRLPLTDGTFVKEKSDATCRQETNGGQKSVVCSLGTIGRLGGAGLTMVIQYPYTCAAATYVQQPPVFETDGTFPIGSAGMTTPKTLQIGNGPDCHAKITATVGGVSFNSDGNMSVIIGQPMHFAVTVKNTGGVDAQHLHFIFPFQADMDVANSSAECIAIAGQGAACAHASPVPPGGSWTANITVTPSACAQGQFGQFTVSGDEGSSATPLSANAVFGTQSTPKPLLFANCPPGPPPTPPPPVPPAVLLTTETTFSGTSHTPTMTDATASTSSSYDNTVTTVLTLVNNGTVPLNNLQAYFNTGSPTIFSQPENPTCTQQAVGTLYCKLSNAPVHGRVSLTIKYHNLACNQFNATTFVASVTPDGNSFHVVAQENLQHRHDQWQQWCTHPTPTPPPPPQTCTQQCTPPECGTPLGMSNTTCADGSIGGPVCLRNPQTCTCSYSIRNCPAPQAPVCGNQRCEPVEATVCPACLSNNPPCMGDCTPGSCPQDCATAPSCGNGYVDVGEQCDHGSANGTPGNSCDATCRILSSGTDCLCQAGQQWDAVHGICTTQNVPCSLADMIRFQGCDGRLYANVCYAAKAGVKKGTSVGGAEVSPARLPVSSAPMATKSTGMYGIPAWLQQFWQAHPSGG